MMNNRAPRQILWLLPLLFSSLPASSQLSQLAAGVAGPQQSPADGRPETSPRTIRGTVVDSVTGEPIYRALVQIGGQYAALTDHEGRFEFNGVVSNGVPAWTMKPGYFPDNHASPNDAQADGRLTSGLGANQPPSITLKLVPEAILFGIVTGPDGTALQGVPVQLKKFAASEGGLMRWQQRNGTTTNSEGQYRFAELEAGRYAVSSGLRLEGLPDAHSSVAYVPARNPPITGDGTEAASRPDTAISLAPGDHREANLTPELEKLYPVSGVVTRQSEGRGVNFGVRTAAGEEISPAVRFNNRTGEFHLMLPGGRYKVTATAYPSQGPLEARSEVNVPQAPGSAVVFAMEPYATISVDIDAQSVNQPGSSPASGAAQQPPSAQTSLVNIDPASASQAFYAGPVKQGNTFTVATGIGPRQIENLPPGRYLLNSQTSPPWYVSSAFCGNIDLVHEELVLAGAEAGCSIRMVLRDDSGALHVTLRDAPARTFGMNPPFVYALPLGDRIRRQVTLGWNGQDFATEAIAPGRYLVLALDHQQELPYMDAEAVRNLAALGQEVTVGPNGRATAEVSVVGQEP